MDAKTWRRPVLGGWVVAIFLPISGVGLYAEEIRFMVSKNGAFTNVVSEDGSLSFTMVQNGPFVNWVDATGITRFTMAENGGLISLSDLGGTVMYTGVWSGPFITLTPVKEPAKSRSEVNRENRQKAEMQELSARNAQESLHETLAVGARNTRESFLKERDDLLQLGFTADELDRQERVLIQLEKAHRSLADYPEPVRSRTGIGESNADFERRHQSWKQRTQRHRDMLTLCEEEIQKFLQKRAQLSGPSQD